MKVFRIIAGLLTIILFTSSIAVGYPEIGEELILNGDFEIKTGDNSGFVNWSVLGGWAANTYINPSTEGRDSSNCVVVDTTVLGNHWVKQDIITDFMDEAEYEVSAWINPSSLSGTAAIRVEFYSGTPFSDNTFLSTGGTDPLSLTGSWQQINYQFIPPEGAAAVAVYVRVMGYGTVYFDDVSLKRTADPRIMELTPEWVFYYSEWGTGTVTADLNTEYYNNLVNGSVEFEIYDDAQFITGSTVSVGTAGITNYTFNLSNLSVIGRPYTVVATVYDSNEVQVDQQSKTIFRYNRPTYIRKDGIFEKNGKVLNPVVMTALPSESMYPGAASLGASIATVYSDATWNKLDSIAAQGMMALVLLYRNMLPAGHPDNIQNTISKVTELKNHPALFGYAIMDEAFYNFDDPSDMLVDSYTAIRNIDQDHPVYMVEINSRKYGEAVKYCDILVADIYPGSSTEPFSYLSGIAQLAVNSAKGEKPVWILHQAFTYGGFFPTGDQMRNFIYRGFLKGAKGMGYYKFQTADGTNNLDATTLGQGIADFYQNEQSVLFDIVQNYTLTDIDETSNAIYAKWENGDSIYKMVLNNGTTSGTTVTVPCEFGADFRIINGIDNEDISRDLESFDVTLPASGVVLYEEVTGNLVENSGFETLNSDGYTPTGWYGCGSNFQTNQVRIDADAHSGENGIIIYPNYRISTNTMPLYESGERYKLTFWFKNTRATGTTVDTMPALEIRDNSCWATEIIPMKTEYTEGNPSIWTKETVYFTAPAHDDSVQRWLSVSLLGKAGYYLRYDDVRMEADKTKIVFTDGSSGELEEIAAGEITASARYIPNTGEDTVEAVLVESVYQMINGVKTLIDVSSTIKRNLSGEPVNLQTSVYIADTADKTVEAYLWNNISGIQMSIKKAVLK